LARYLALDWDHNQLHVVLAHVSGGSVRVLHAHVFPEEASLSVSNAAAVGERLKARLKELKIAPAPVLATLGRERIIVKDIRYPIVPAHEEPGVVRFQAVKELTGAAEESVIDYTPVGDSGNERRALVLVAKREQVNAYQELCKAAGLKLAAVTPRPFGLATCIERVAGTTVLTPRPEPADGAVAVLAVGDGWAEFCVTRGGTLLLARSLTPGPNLAAEVRRSLAVYSGQGAAQPVRAIYVAGAADNAALRERLHNLTDLPTHLLDPFAGADPPEPPAQEKRGGFAGLVGVLYLRGDRTGLPVNFAEPKQPRPPEDPNKRKLLIGAGIAAAIFLAIGTLAFIELNRLDRQVKEQVARNKKWDEALLIAEEDAKRVKAISAWTDQNVVWLDELYDLTDRFPEPDTAQLRMVEIAANLVDRPANAKEKEKHHTGSLYLKGVSGDDNAPVDQLVARFRSDGYDTTPKHMEPGGRGGPAGLGRGSGFTQVFTVARIDIDKRSPSKYTRRIEDKPDDNDRRRGGRRGGP
jgi:Tfp pilus assembly PilM family ATPase